MSAIRQPYLSRLPSASLSLFSSRESANCIIARSRGGSHVWTRGYRFGEAKHPGPPKPSVASASINPTRFLTDNLTPTVCRWVPCPVPSSTPPPTPKTRSSAPQTPAVPQHIALFSLLYTYTLLYPSLYCTLPILYPPYTVPSPIHALYSGVFEHFSGFLMPFFLRIPHPQKQSCC